MLKWLLRKQIARAEALEHYLLHFNAGELSYLKNLVLMGLAGPRSVGSLSQNDEILLAAYIQVEWMALTGQIENSVKAKARARASYNMELASDISKVGQADGLSALKVVGGHRLSQPELTGTEEDRLGAHFIVLTRLFRDPKGASTLPELNELGEGTDWLPFR